MEDHNNLVALNDPENKYGAAVTMPISVPLLIEMLHLPKGTLIVGATVSFEDFGRTVKLLVMHPDIPKDATIVIPEFKSHYDEKGNVINIEFMGWGAKR